ncbi:MAG: tetratricopeptide repeat protein [Treponema sp.]|nr:tetratricopeptide repeat protein [Spirochaetia bacterium]MDD7274333.1 tetratricopeptide repeat protein [Treponema sp.]
MKRKFFLILAIITMSVFSLFASDAYETGYNLFTTNKPAEAIPYLETALNDLAVSPSVYVYLGIAYYQTGKYPESLDIFKRGLSASGTNKRIIAFNAGNSAYAMRDYATAEEMFSLASVADPAFAAPVLNRANARLSQDKLQGALEDYQRYLVLDPYSSQRAEVEAIIRALQGEMVYREEEKERLAQEEQRMKEEEARIQAENQRIAEEKAEAARKEAERLAAERAAEEARLAAQREAEAERRRRLLEEVAASLQDTETTGMNAGSEGVIEYEYESELD